MLQLKYLRDIDRALGSGGERKLNGRFGTVNKFLQTMLGWRTPAELTNPCRLLSCNREAAPNSMFCSPEHEHMYMANTDSLVRVKITSLWSLAPELREEFGRGCNLPGWRWNNIQLVDGGDYDYLVVINKPHHTEPVYPERTISFHMEPHMETQPSYWGEWIDPEKNLKILKCFSHKVGYNNLQWHLNKTYTQLMTEPIVKTENRISAINSSKYSEFGHCLRWDFCTYMVRHRPEIPLDIFGTNRFNLPNHKGPLPPLDKTGGTYPYKYHLAVENNSINNCVTEKLVDGILSECLVFYWGCPNIREIIDPRAFVHIECGNFIDDASLIERAIKEDWWSQRIEYIREAKKKIINDLAFLPRLEKYLATLRT